MTTYNYFVRPHEGFCFFQLSIMSKRNTAFKVSMLDGEDSNQDPIQNWAKPHDNHSVRCLLCQEIVSIAQRGKDQLIRHSKTGTHIKRRQNNLGDDRKLKRLVDTQRNIQTCFASGSAGADDGREDWQKRSLNNNVTYAETMWCANVSVNNLSFRLSDSMIAMFPRMFPDSKIAKEFQCASDKTAYVVSDGMGPYMHTLIENEIRNFAPAYSIQVDEATTAKHWRQFDVIVRYWPAKSDRVRVEHLESFEMGHADATKLKDNIVRSLSGLYHDKLLQISSDGPNVMKSLQKKAMEEINPKMINIGTCNLHKSHNAFSSAFKKFGSEIESIGIDVFYLFKYSAARREDYEAVQKSKGIKGHVFLRHVSSRWTTLEDVTERLMEQLPALTEYFLRTLTDKERENDRIKRICGVLSNKLLKCELLFMKSVLSMFNRFNKLIQSEGPLIHILYDEMNTLILSLM